LLVHGERFAVRHYKTKTALTEYLEDTTSDEQYWQRYDECFNLKHQYACTVHKAQGSSYSHVFVDLSDIKAQLDKKPTSHNNYAKPIAYNTYLRLVYVALSRMRHSATVYLGNTRTYNLLRS
jgi:ATP-dependent exoDNAse (exonuclease V) alpha subunit